jgi:hypothetical protein
VAQVGDRTASSVGWVILGMVLRLLVEEHREQGGFSLGCGPAER